MPTHQGGVAESCTGAISSIVDRNIKFEDVKSVTSGLAQCLYGEVFPSEAEVSILVDLGQLCLLQEQDWLRKNCQTRLAMATIPEGNREDDSTDRSLKAVVHFAPETSVLSARAYVDVLTAPMDLTRCPLVEIDRFLPPFRELYAVRKDSRNSPSILHASVAGRLIVDAFTGSGGAFFSDMDGSWRKYRVSVTDSERWLGYTYYSLKMVSISFKGSIMVIHTVFC